MATKRMFSKDIVGSDAFQDMPSSSQLLYFHLGMEADDDGFVGNPKKISRSIGLAEDDLKILLAKRFVLVFSSGVLVIKHHRINNNWDKYNCKRTVYMEEFNQLYIKENKAYTKDKTQGLELQSENSLKTVFRGEENKGEEKRIKEVLEVSLPSPVRKTKTHFLNTRRKEKGLPPSVPRRSMKQVETTKALLDIDYFKSKGYEMHGMQFFKVESDERNKVARKLFIKNREVLGDDIRPLIDWWFSGAGEFCDYSPEVAMSVKVVEKFQNSKRKIKNSDDEIFNALKAIR